MDAMSNNKEIQDYLYSNLRRSKWNKPRLEDSLFKNQEQISL